LGDAIDEVGVLGRVLGRRLLDCVTTLACLIEGLLGPSPRADAEKDGNANGEKRNAVHDEGSNARYRES